MPGAADRPLSLGLSGPFIDNVAMRTRLREAQPDTEDAMLEQRRECIEARYFLTRKYCRRLWLAMLADFAAVCAVPTRRPSNPPPMSGHCKQMVLRLLTILWLRRKD